jgi:hypothetical protein
MATEILHSDPASDFQKWSPRLASTEIYIEEQAEIIARKAVEGFQQAPRCDGDWAGRTFEAYELLAMVGEIANYPTYMLRDEIAGAACDIIDEWGGPWVRAEERPDPQGDLFAEDHL